MTRRLRLFPVDGEPIEVELARERGGGITLRSPTGDFAGELLPIVRGEMVLCGEDGATPVYTARVGPELHVWLRGRVYRFRTEEAPAVARGASGTRTENDVRAPMPGKIMEVHAQAGSAIAAGQTLVVLESMKVRFNLTAPRDGVVKEVACAAGDLVELGTVLVLLEPAA